MKQVINEMASSSLEDVFYDALDSPHCDDANMHLVNSAVSFTENSSDFVKTFNTIKETAVYIQEISIEDN